MKIQFFIFANIISKPKLINVKKYLFISILLSLPFCLSAQSKKSIDGFMDISFGSDSVTVKAAVIAKRGTQKPIPLPDKNKIGFTDFSMSQRQVNELYVNFVDNKAYNAFFFFHEDTDSILNSYDGFVADLTAVYGKPKEAHDFNELSNTNKIRKLLAGNIVIETMWQSKNKNTITLTITPLGQSLELMLRYEDSSLFELNAAKRRSDL
jgi:hypothetical protein